MLASSIVHVETAFRPVETRQATFSIAVADDRNGIAGAATASRYVAVGSLVLHAGAGAGVIVTQSIADRNHGTVGLPLLAAGEDPARVLDEILRDDDILALRQVAIVRIDGATAHFTGTQCTPEVATVTEPGLVAIGNMLADAAVPAAMAAEFHRIYDDPRFTQLPDPLGSTNPHMEPDTAAERRQRANRMAEALIAALRAGDVAGGRSSWENRRQVCSSSLTVQDMEVGMTARSTCGWTITGSRSSNLIASFGYSSPTSSVSSLNSQGTVGGRS
jgi:uncharacterized Ntn-hydrolase superfamily protein